MNPARLQIRCLASLLLAASALAQDTSAPVHKSRTPRVEPPPYNVNTIFLDPSHGGDDLGARLGPNSLEKDATLALAEHLRTLLSKDAFTLVTTRSANPDQPSPDAATSSPAPTLDQRVEAANRSRSVACLILHATTAGHGIHLYTSGLPAPTPNGGEISGLRAIVPWNTAQAASLQGSQQLASDLAAAIDSTHIPLVSGHVSVKPIDSMTCPAILVELGSLASGTLVTPPSDPGYQQRVAQALASGLHTWRAHAQAQIEALAQLQAQAQAQAQAHAQAQTQAQASQTKAGTPAAKPRPTPKPASIPEEIPDVRPPAPVLPPRPPAPIIRRQPQPVPAPVPPPSGAPR